MWLSWIWRILQIKEDVIFRPLWITPSEICRILNILRKPNSITALLFIPNISLFLKEFCHFAFCCSSHQNNTTLSSGFLGQWFHNLQWAALLTSLVRYLVNSSWLWWIMNNNCYYHYFYYYYYYYYSLGVCYY